MGESKGVTYFCVAEAPELEGPSTDVQKHISWMSEPERIVKDAFLAQRKTIDAQARANKTNPFPRATQWRARYSYAVRCSIDKPKLAHIDACSPMVFDEIKNCAQPNKLILIFALGPSIFKTFGIKFKKYGDIQGKFVHAELNDQKVAIFASLSKRQLLAKTGFFGILQQHVEIFLETVRRIEAGDTEITNASVPLQELIKNYEFPQTVDEVGKLVERIIAYAPEGRDPTRHIISIDTETNTVYPHRKKAKILNLVVSWGKGLAAAIPMEHSETSWTLAEVRPYIQALLECEKPKIFQNAKFDLRMLTARGFTVRKVRWDTMLGEHLLAEDKRGYYGLKFLTSMWIPKYAGYDEELERLKTEKARALEEKRKAKGAKSDLKGAAKKLYEDDGYAAINLKALNEYGAVDADVTRQLCLLQRRRMEIENADLQRRRAALARSPYYSAAAVSGTTIQEPLTNLMFRHLVPATKTLAEMESHGIAVDRKYIAELADELDFAIVESKAKLLTMVPLHLYPGGFNPDSPPQLRALFFSYGYKHPEKQEMITYKGRIPEDELIYTDGGELSTSAAVLRKLRDQWNCPFATELLHYRAIAKARGNFISNIMALSEEDGRMHTTFHIPGTATGRLSSSDENMQNIPGWIGEYNIKKIFVPSRPGNIIVNADAKAAEVRLYAAYSRDPNLIKALLDGLDPHSFFANTVYNPEAVLSGVPPGRQEEVLKIIGIDNVHDWSYDDFQKRDEFAGTTENPGPKPAYGKRLKKLRSNIKRVVFGILYGASKYKISSIVGIPDEQGQAIIDVLFKMFPTIPAYIKLTEQQVEKLGVVETFMGRRRRFDLRGMTGWMRSKAKRQAVNFKIQSTASELVIDVLNAINGPLKDIGGEMLITVHDSLVFEIPKQYVGQVPDLIQQYGVDRIAKKYPWLPVPFSWDVEVGSSYGELQSVDKFLKQHPFQVPAHTSDMLDEHEIRQNFQMNPHIAV